MLHWDDGGSADVAAALLGCELRREGLLCRVVLPAYGAGPYLPAIVMERPVYVREMSDGLYSPLTYLLYKVGMSLTLLPVLPLTSTKILTIPHSVREAIELAWPCKVAHVQ